MECVLEWKRWGRNSMFVCINIFSYFQHSWQVRIFLDLSIQRPKRELKIPSPSFYHHHFLFYIDFFPTLFRPLKFRRHRQSFSFGLWWTTLRPVTADFSIHRRILKKIDSLNSIHAILSNIKTLFYYQIFVIQGIFRNTMFSEVISVHKSIKFNWLSQRNSKITEAFVKNKHFLFQRNNLS